MTADPRLATKLEELAEAPAPPMNIDVEHARQLGQRRLYTRRATLAAGVAAVVGAAATATPSVLRAVTTPVPGVPPTPHLDANPLIAYAEFGWLPDSITRVEVANGKYGDYLQAVNEDDDPGTSFLLSVHPTSDMSAYFRDPRRKPVTVPAPPVNSRTAHWVTLNASDPLNNGDAHLVWQAPGGRWVLLRGHLSVFPDPRDVLLRIAAGVTVAERPLPLPVLITGLPAEFRVHSADFYRPMPRYEGTGAWALKLSYDVNQPAFSIEVHPEGSSRIAKAIPGMVRKTAKGIDVYVGLSNYEPGPINAIGGAQGILDRITPLGMDEREWTTRPVS